MTLHIAEITFEQSKLRADNVQLVCRFDRFEGYAASMLQGIASYSGMDLSVQP